MGLSGETWFWLIAMGLLLFSIGGGIGIIIGVESTMNYIAKKSRNEKN